MSNDAVERSDGGSEWSVGSAKRVITPDEPMWMAGFASRDEPANGVEHDLHATAVALEDDDGSRVAIVSADVLCVPRDLRDRVVDGCVEKFDLVADAVMVAATHTHCGPEFREFKLDMYADDPAQYVEQANAYRERLEAELVSTVGAAVTDLQPARLSYSRARCGFAMNRRLPVEDGIAHVSNPEGPVDHDVPVLVAERGDEPTAILFGYACHPTTLSIDRYCGDWIGFARREIEAEYRDATAVFLLGFAGDQNPYPRRELTLAKHYGRSMATSVRAAIEARRTSVRGPLRSLFGEQSLAFEDPPSRAELESMTEADERYRRVRANALLDTLDEDGDFPDEYPYPIQAFGFGDDLTIVGLAGEVLVEYGLRLKEDLPGPLFAAGYANDEFTYVPTTQAAYEGGYEGGDAIQRSQLPAELRPDLEERILRRTRSMVERVRGDRDVE